MVERSSEKKHGNVGGGRLSLGQVGDDFGSKVATSFVLAKTAILTVLSHLAVSTAFAPRPSTIVPGGSGAPSDSRPRERKGACSVACSGGAASCSGSRSPQLFTVHPGQRRERTKT